MNLNFRWKSKSQIGRKLGFAASKTVSNLRRFKKVSDEKIAELKKETIKKRTYAKMQWGVKAFRDWRHNRLSNVNGFDVRIYECDIDRVELLEKDLFEYAMCAFLAEVTKVKDGAEYPGKTLYQMVVSIQKYLNSNGVHWKLVESVQFNKIRTVLDNLMKERAIQQIGTVRKQAQLIDFQTENQLWESGVLGEQSPDQLRNTVLFLLGLNVGLRAGDEQYALRRDSAEKPSQLSFKRNGKGVRCLVYQEDSVTKTNDGGLSSMRKNRKCVWVYPSDNVVRCPVRLVDKYVSLLPPVKPNRKCNFYLRSLEKYTPAQWYGDQVVGLNTLRTVMKDIAKKANLESFVTNHSLRRTGTTRLFRGGVDRKLVKEYTGHSSDAVDQYQITSDEQRESLSKIIAGESHEKPRMSEVEVAVTEKSWDTCMSCKCNKKVIEVNELEKLGSLINTLVTAKGQGKAKVKIEIEFSS